MLVCTKRDKPDSTALELDGREIEPYDNVKYLGGLTDHKLHVEFHVDSLVAKASQSLHIVKTFGHTSTKSLSPMLF